MAATALPGVYRLTFQDWLDCPDDGYLYELVEGELFVTPPPPIEHQRISRNLGDHLLQHLKLLRDAEVLAAPVGVRLSDENVLEPDLVVVLAEHKDRIGEQVIEGAPDLVVEILSKRTAKRDLGIKRARYQAAGVAEYWIADPATNTVEVLFLEREAYARHGLFGRTDTLTSRVLPGLRIPLDTVFAK